MFVIYKKHFNIAGVTLGVDTSVKIWIEMDFAGPVESNLQCVASVWKW